MHRSRYLARLPPGAELFLSELANLVLIDTIRFAKILLAVPTRRFRVRFLARTCSNAARQLAFFLSWAVGLKHRSGLTGAALASVPWRWPRRCARISVLLEWERARDGLLGFVLAGSNFLFAMQTQIGNVNVSHVHAFSLILKS